MTNAKGSSINLGIVGTGAIVHDSLNALSQIKNVHICAIWAPENEYGTAKTLAEQYKIDKVYLSYEKMLEDDEINLIYIGIINCFHFSFSKDALMAGKNVICEKPFTSNFCEANELAKIAKSKNVLLFEAINLLYLPNYLVVKDQLKKIKDIKIVRCNYSQRSRRYDSYLEGNVHSVFDPKFAGGALMDINIYNIHFIVGLFGKPLGINYFCNRGYNGIDTSGITILNYEDFTVECCGAKDSVSPSEIIIQGGNGFVRVNGSPNVCNSVDVVIDKKLEHINNNMYEHRLVNEFMAFCAMVENNDFDKCQQYLRHSLSVMEIITSARVNSGILFPADELM